MPIDQSQIKWDDEAPLVVDDIGGKPADGPMINIAGAAPSIDQSKIVWDEPKEQKITGKDIAKSMTGLSPMEYGGLMAAANFVQKPAQAVINGAALLSGDGLAGKKVKDWATEYNDYLRKQEAQYQADTDGSISAGLGRFAAGAAPTLLMGGGNLITQGGKWAMEHAAELGLKGKMPQWLAEKTGNAVGGGTLGALTSLQSPVNNASSPDQFFDEMGNQIRSGTAVGAALPGAGDMIGGIGNYMGRVGKSLFATARDSGKTEIADNVLSKFAKDGPTAINAAEIVPGSTPTLSQATGNPGIATMERGIRDLFPNRFAQLEKQNNAARLSLFNEHAGDKDQLAYYANDLKTTANKLYGDALAKGVDPAAVTPAVTKQINLLMGRPSIQKAIGEAKKLAAEENLQLTDATSLQGLHYTKMALDAQIADASRKENNNLVRLLTDTRNRLDGVLTKISPAYKEASATFSEMSKPVDAMTVLQGLRLTDAKGNITLAQTQNAICSIEQRQAASGTNQAKAVSEEQLNALKAIRDDLLRRSNSELGKSIGSNTFQNFGTSNMMEKMVPGIVGKILGSASPEWAGSGIGGGLGFIAGGAPGAAMGATAGNVLGRGASALMKNSDEAIRERIAERLLDPNLGFRALNGGSAPIAAQSPLQAFGHRLSPYVSPLSTIGAVNASN